MKIVSINVYSAAVGVPVSLKLNALLFVNAPARILSEAEMRAAGTIMPP